MYKVSKVKSNVAILKIIINENNINEPAKFKLFNAGDDVYYKVISKGNRKYEFENNVGTILKSHYIEITINVLFTTPDMYFTEDVILVNIFDKEFGQIIQTIEMPLRVLNQYQTHKSSSVQSLTSFETPVLRNRNRQLGEEKNTASQIRIQNKNECNLHPVVVWVVKKLIFLIICSTCVVVIVLPLKGFPLSEPHPDDNWVTHLARIWPKNLLPNHLIQYLAIMILGAAMAVFLFIY